MIDKVHIYICILAALAVVVVNILLESPLVVMVPQMIFFIVFFYFIGLTVRFYLKKKVFAAKEQDAEASEVLLEENGELENADGQDGQDQIDINGEKFI